MDLAKKPERGYETHEWPPLPPHTRPKHLGSVLGGGGKIHKMALVASKPNNQTAYNKISKIHRKQDKNHQATQKPEQPTTKYLIKA